MNTIEATPNQTPLQRQMLVIGGETKPITNLPLGARVRVRTTPLDLPRAFVKTKYGISEHIILDCGDHWEIFHKAERFHCWAHKTLNTQRQ